MSVRWQGGDLGRLVNARHAAMHEAMARFFKEQPSWVAEPEVSFSIWGERGSIDVLAWHATARALLVIELKSELVDLNDLLSTLDRKLRLATRIAATRGWRPGVVGTWLVVANSRTNRRAVERHAAALRSKLPGDGRALRRWLAKPDYTIAALGFLPSVHGVHVGTGAAPVKRVVKPKNRALGNTRSTPGE
jgi:hypothetical protein